MSLALKTSQKQCNSIRVFVIIQLVHIGAECSVALGLTITWIERDGKY